MSDNYNPNEEALKREILSKPDGVVTRILMDFFMRVYPDNRNFKQKAVVFIEDFCHENDYEWGYNNFNNVFIVVKSLKDPKNEG